MVRFGQRFQEGKSVRKVNLEKRKFKTKETVSIILTSIVADNHMRQLNSWNVASDTEYLIFFILFITINYNVIKT